MSESKHRVGAGDVEIVLDGQTLTLRPTWQAAQAISRQAGGLMGAIQKLLAVDLDTVINVVALGLGYGPNRPMPADLPNKIWTAGVSDEGGQLITHCVRYVRVLANGGRPPPEAEEPTEELSPNPQS